MKRKLALLAGAVAVVTAVLVITLGGGGHTPQTEADNSSATNDIILCDAKTGGQNSIECNTTGATMVGDGDGIIEMNEHPMMITDLIIDPPPDPKDYDQPFFSAAYTTWKGLTPGGGAAIPDGAISGKNFFVIQSNLTAPASSNIGPTGQPPVCDAESAVSPPRLQDTFRLYDSDLGTATDKDIGEGPGLIRAALDGPDAGTDADTQEDLRDANGTEEGVNDDGDGATDEDPVNGIDDDGDCVGDPPPSPPGWGPCATSGGIDEDGGSNGLFDGVDMMPDELANRMIPDIVAATGATALIARAYGVAKVANIAGTWVYQDVNYLNFTLPDGRYLAVTTIAYPGGASQQPGTTSTVLGMTVQTCPPFEAKVYIYGQTAANTVACDTTYCAGSPAPNIAGGVDNRTAAEEGKFVYSTFVPSAANYDGDMAAGDFETCHGDVSVDADLRATGYTDNAAEGPFGDRWDTACDPKPLSVDNDGDTQTTYDTVPINTLPNDPHHCNKPYITNPIAWDCDQDVDGDTTLNAADNCPKTPDGDADADGNEDGSEPGPGLGNCNNGGDDGDGDTLADYLDPDCWDNIDWQLDSDADGVGDMCDGDADVVGNGDGYAVDIHPHGLNLGTDPPGSPGYYHNHDLRCSDSFGIPSIEGKAAQACDIIIDSNNDGVADWEDSGAAGYQIGEPVDVASDSDEDGHTDGCEAVEGTDPLDPTSEPASPTDGDCDDDGVSDVDEVAQSSDFTDGATQATATPTATPEPKGAVEAECTHRVTGTEPLEVDIVCHLTSGPADPTPTGTPAAPIPTPVHDWEVIYNDQVPAWPDPALEPVECTITVDGNSSPSTWVGYVADLDGDSVIETAKCRDEAGTAPWVASTCRDMHVKVSAGEQPPHPASPIYVHLTGLDQSNVGLIESVESPDLPPECGVAPTPTATPACTDREGDTACNNPSTDPDDDGCTNAQEIALGDTFSGDAWYDVYDVVVPAKEDAVGDGYGDDLPPIGANGKRNKVVDIGDVLAVLFYAFADQGGPPNANGVAYDAVKGWDGDGDTDNDASPIHDIPEGLKYDRTPGLGPSSDTGNDPVGAPNGAIDIGDVLGALGQAFKVDCS